jgi:hypothetical protein
VGDHSVTSALATKNGAEDKEKVLGKRVMETAPLKDGRSSQNPGTRLKQITARGRPKPHWCPAGLTKTQRRRLEKIHKWEIDEDHSVTTKA